MERESFEDLEVAEVLNKYFICIKVDREERPDIDHIYMSVCQALTGSGGWPLTVFITPDKEPFYAGTYFPKKDRMGMLGLISILKRVNSAWSSNRESLMHSSKEILNAISDNNESFKTEINSEITHTAFSQLERSFDKVYGGFGNAPKFPTPHNLYFLLRYWQDTQNQKALDMVEKTLDSMYSGGIYDHIGFGFSRYSTDRQWLVPHFEKMLYDNALLAIAYLEAFQATGKEKYGSIVREIFTYLLRDMTSPEGGFYSAEDADSEGVEGKFYVWSYEEVLKVLGAENGTKTAAYYHITANGNFEGKSIPNIIDTEEKANSELINDCRDKLFRHREARVHPYKDDKILTSWNGLVIAALALGARILRDDQFRSTAEKAVSFIYDKLFRSDGRLLARYRDGEAALPAYADDYSFLIWGLIELYQATYMPEYLKKALALNSDLLRFFWDDKNGGLFIYGSDSEQLILRPKDIYDGATPSGNSVSALNMLRLSRLTGQFELEEKALGILKAFSQNIDGYPKAYCFSLMALQFSEAVSREIVLVSDTENSDLQDMLDVINEDFRPYTMSIMMTDDKSDIKKLVPFVAGYTAASGAASAYVCENFACHTPVTDAQAFKSMLEASH